MNVLPFADEVREARALAAQAEKAANLSQRIGIVLSAVSITERQVRSIDTDEVEIPGAEVIAEAIDTYPELAGLSAIAPDPSTPALRQLAQRRLQLKTIDQLVRPLAADHHERMTRVHELQHQQIKALQDPRFDALRAELDARGEVRRKGFMTVSRLRSRRQSMLPTERAIDDFLPQVQTELDNEGSARDLEFARMRLLTLVDTLGITARSVGMEAHLPDTTVLADPDCSRASMEAAVAGLQQLRAATQIEIEMLEAEISRIEAEIDEATEWMVSRTG